MVITVQRKIFTPQSTIGDMWIDGKKEYVSLEPVTTTADVKPRAIPAGTYDLTIRPSKRFGKLMPHVERVPGFEGILIHWGNYPKDTDGCLLLGQYAGPQDDFIGGSRHAFDEFYKRLLQASPPHFITYTHDVPAK